MQPIEGPERVFFGKRKDDKAMIYLSKPSWDCGWYWGFGYLGNHNEHYHLNAYQQKNHYLKLADGSHKLITEARNMSMYDALLADYDLNVSLLKDDLNVSLLKEKNAFGLYPKLYVFCELALTAYALKEAAEVLGWGGSNMTTNPCAELIKNPQEVDRINHTVLPALFNAINDLFKE